METRPPILTPYPAIDSLLIDLHTRLQAVLATSYAGLALHGSLALGDFSPETSDIDLLVITAKSLDLERVRALRRMHRALAEAHLRWAQELEVSYLPLFALRRHDPAHPAFPRLARGSPLVVEPHHSDWIIQRHILREHGIVVFGPQLRGLIDPVEEAALQTAVLEIRWWWEEQVADPHLLVQDAYQAFAVLSMCRMLATLQKGDILTKPQAARWAQAKVARPWADLIEAALIWRPGQPMARLDEAIAFIRFTLGESRAYEM